MNRIMDNNIHVVGICGSGKINLSTIRMMETVNKLLKGKRKQINQL